MPQPFRLTSCVLFQFRFVRRDLAIGRNCWQAKLDKLLVGFLPTSALFRRQQFPDLRFDLQDADSNRLGDTSLVRKRDYVTLRKTTIAMYENERRSSPATSQVAQRKAVTLNGKRSA